MPKAEQALMQTIGDYIGINLREFYMSQDKSSSDMELLPEFRREMHDKAYKVMKDRGIKFILADNDCDGYSDGYECCGTEILRDYTILGQNLRTQAFGVKEGNFAKILPDCNITFTRQPIKGTIAEAIERYEKKFKAKNAPTLFEKVGDE